MVRFVYHICHALDQSGEPSVTPVHARLAYMVGRHILRIRSDMA